MGPVDARWPRTDRNLARGITTGSSAGDEPLGFLRRQMPVSFEMSHISIVMRHRFAGSIAKMTIAVIPRRLRSRLL